MEYIKNIYYYTAKLEFCGMFWLLRVLKTVKQCIIFAIDTIKSSLQGEKCLSFKKYNNN